LGEIEIDRERVEKWLNQNKGKILQIQQELRELRKPYPLYTEMRIYGRIFLVIGERDFWIYRIRNDDYFLVYKVRLRR